MTNSIGFWRYPPPILRAAYLKKQIKGWRTKFFVFMTNRNVPPTNNISEREIQASVVF